MNQKYYVYWYKLPEHKNPMKEGYIGITNNMERRDAEHRRNKHNTHFANALAKYDNISYSVLHTVAKKEEALALEYEYRPALNIGWNYAVGGEDTLKSTASRPITVYHKDNYVVTVTYPSIKSAAKALNVTEGSLRARKYRQTTSYSKKGWAILHSPEFDRTTTLTYEEAKHLAVLGIKRNKPSHFKGKLRWSKADKERISKQHKGKTISDEQKRIVGEKNSKNPSLCKVITLKHISSDKQYTFHSITEASKQLELPLSRLKSKAQRPLKRYGKDGWAITHLGS